MMDCKLLLQGPFLGEGYPLPKIPRQRNRHSGCFQFVSPQSRNTITSNAGSGYAVRIVLTPIFAIISHPSYEENHGSSLGIMKKDMIAKCTGPDYGRPLFFPLLPCSVTAIAYHFSHTKPCVEKQSSELRCTWR